MEMMQQWFNNLKQHEQLMLVFCGFFVALYLIYILLWAPTNQSIDTLRAQNEVERSKLGAVKQLASQYKLLKSSSSNEGTAPKKNLTKIVNETVAKHQLSMSRFQPSSSGTAQVRFENASFNSVLAWLYEVENERSLAVKDLSITQGNNVGRINLSVRVYQGG